MNLVQIVLNAVLTAAKDSPKATLFLAILGFLAFMFYVAMIIAGQGSRIFLLYCILAIATLLLLTFIAFKFYSN